MGQVLKNHENNNVQFPDTMTRVNWTVPLSWTNMFMYLYVTINPKIVNPNQDGRQNAPTSFSLVTSTKVGISTQNFFTFNCNPFATLG